MRRIEAGMWIEDRVKEGYTKGSWEHIKQSDKVLIKAWNPGTTREGEALRKAKDWRAPKVNE